MTLHLFIDDLEETLRQNDIDHLYLCSEKETEDAEQHLYAYLQENFVLEVNQQKVEYQFVGKEQSEDLIGIWVYLEVTGVVSIEEVTVTNQLLVDTFEDQKNITSIMVPPGRQNYFILDYGKRKESVNFK